MSEQDKEIYNKTANMLLNKHKKQVLSNYRNKSQITNQDQIKFQQLVNNNAFARQLFDLSNRLCFIYDNPNWHSIVLEILDLELIYKNVDSEIDSYKKSNKDFNESQYTDFLVKELLRYFKNDFFKWVDQPDCPNCGPDNKDIEPTGIQRPTPSEAQFQCGAVETYRCKKCNNQIRFPRYNDPIKLLETRAGRCGEWCNLFTLILKSFGLDTRYIWNKEDHVWCEYYSNYHKNWLHLDSCEQSFNQPYIYSKNWNKKMSYCISFSNEGVHDVSKRYILQNQLPRDSINELDLNFFCQFLTKRLRMQFNDDDLYKFLCRDEIEKISFLPISKTQNNNNIIKTDKDTEKGRVSGSAEWKKGRGEDGKQ